MSIINPIVYTRIYFSKILMMMFSSILIEFICLVVQFQTHPTHILNYYSMRNSSPMSNRHNVYLYLCFILLKIEYLFSHLSDSIILTVL